MALVPLLAGPDQPRTDGPSASMTMRYVVVGLGTVFSWDRHAAGPDLRLTPPLLNAVKWSVLPLVLILSTELGFPLRGLHTQELTARHG